METDATTDSIQHIIVNGGTDVVNAAFTYRYSADDTGTMTIGGGSFSGIIQNVDFYDFYVDATQQNKHICPTAGCNTCTAYTGDAVCNICFIGDNF